MTVPNTANPFDLDTAVRPLGDDRFSVEISERWWVVAGPNGGFVAALVLRALQAVEPARSPRSLTLQFPAAPQQGPAEIVVRTVRRGGSVTFLSAEMHQDGEVKVTALAVFSETWSGPEYLTDEAKMPDVFPPGELIDISETGKGVPPVFRNFLSAPAVGDLPFSGGTDPVTGGWLTLKEPRLLDEALAAAMLDAWFPAPFVILDAPAPAPTLDLTIHFRAPIPPPDAKPEDPYLIVFSSSLARDGMFEEDGRLWSPGGTLLAQSRQLALLRHPRGQ